MLKKLRSAVPILMVFFADKSSSVLVRKGWNTKIPHAHWEKKRTSSLSFVLSFFWEKLIVSSPPRFLLPKLISTCAVNLFWDDRGAVSCQEFYIALCRGLALRWFFGVANSQWVIMRKNNALHRKFTELYQFHNRPLTLGPIPQDHAFHTMPGLEYWSLFELLSETNTDDQF